MDTKQPKPSRFEIEHKYLKAIAAVDEKLETFIKQKTYTPPHCQDTKMGCIWWINL